MKKNCNHLIDDSIFCEEDLNIDFDFKFDQLEIDYLDEIFFETLEIFLAAVFLLIMPNLATCIRID